MSHQWGPQGPAFEVQGVYRSENRALLARAALLGVPALLLLVLALADPSLPRGLPTKLLRLPQDGRMLHVMLGLLLLALAGVDVLRATRQRALRLLPGQPGSLVTPQRSARAPNPDAAGLVALLDGGTAPRAPMATGWPLLARLSPALVEAPLGLQSWMAQRLAHLAWIGGLTLGLLIAWLLLRPSGVAMMGALCVAVAAFVLLRSRQPGRVTPGPRTVALQLALTLAAGLAGGLLVPEALGAPLSALGLAQGAAVMLVALLLAELVALAAGRVAVDQPLARGPAPAACSVEIDADAESVQQEVERELHRYWSEGVPNRRYLWQGPPAGDRGSAAGFETSSLEESQPLLLATGEPNRSGGVRRPWLLALLALGLLFTLGGGLLWGVVVWQQLQRAARPWQMGSAAVLLFFAGGYAIRVAHLLWSRVEAQSLLFSLNCRTGEAAGAPVQLRWAVTRARSAFYAAAEHGVGSRVLLELTSDEAAAQRSAQQVKRYAQKINAAEAQDSRPPPAPAPRPPRAPMPMPAQSAAAEQRFCVDCGASVPVAARYCPGCGERQRGG